MFIWQIKQGNRKYQTSPPSPEEDRATTVGNMHQKFGKDRYCGKLFARR